jgi:hypothetical protein
VEVGGSSAIDVDVKDGASNNSFIVRRIGFPLVAVIAIALFLVSGAGSQSSAGPPFFDRTGDAPARFDIKRVDVSEQPDGSVFIEVTIAGTVNWDEDGPLIALDLDQNPDTGSAFYGTEYEVAFLGEGNAREGQPVLMRAHGWDFKRVQPLGHWQWELGPHVVGFFFDRSAFGLSPTTGFNLVAATLGSTPDTAPDIGTFHYQPVPGPPPHLGPDRRAPHVVAYDSVGVHGKVAELEYWVLDGRGRTADTIRIYRGKHLLKTIRRRLRNSNPFDQSQVTWRVPKNVRGNLRFSVRASDAAGNRSKPVSAPLEIR